MKTRMGMTRTSSGYRSLRRALSDGAPSDAPLTELLLAPAPTTTYLLFIIFIATLGPFQFGYHLGELNAPETVITCKAKSIPTAAASSSDSSLFPQCIPMSAAQWGLVQSIFTVGGLAGSVCSGAVATRFGRLIAMMTLTAALAVGSGVEATACSIFTLALGRFLAGIGAGAATVVCPIYIAELSPPQKRGLFGAFTQVMINAGILTAQALGYFLSRDSLWRIILAFPSVCSILTLLALFFAPETPVWLVDHGESRAARDVLRALRGTEADIRGEMQSWRSGDMDEEEQSLLLPRESIPSEKQTTVTISDVIRIPKYRTAVVAVTATFVAQQLCGINSVVMFSVAILGDILPSAAALITVMVSATNLTVSVLCTPLPDTLGRKGCLLLSICGMGLSSAMLALGLSFDIAVLTVISLFTFVASFCVGLGPVPFILASEVVGPEAVGALSSWALAGNWLSTFCVAQFFPMLNQALPGGRVFWIFTGVALVLGTFIAWKVPETKGKTNPSEIWEDM